MRTRVAGQTLDFFQQEVDRLDGELAEQGAAIQAFQEANRDSLPDSLEFRRGQLVSAAAAPAADGQRRGAAARPPRSASWRSTRRPGSVALAPNRPQTPRSVQLEDAAQPALLGARGARPRPTRASASCRARSPRSRRRSPPRRRRQRRRRRSSPGLSAYDVAARRHRRPDRRRSRPSASAIAGAAWTRCRPRSTATPGNAIRARHAAARLRRPARPVRPGGRSNRSAAETGEQIEALSRGQRISIIEQATPPQPARSSPNRPLIAGGRASAAASRSGWGSWR